MNITSAQYTTSIISGENDSITVVSNGITMSVPLDPDNADYTKRPKQSTLASNPRMGG